jgi:hypothetical protein
VEREGSQYQNAISNLVMRSYKLGFQERISSPRSLDVFMPCSEYIGIVSEVQ